MLAVKKLLDYNQKINKNNHTSVKPLPIKIQQITFNEAD